MTAEIRVAAAIILDDQGRMLVVRKTGTEVFMQPGGKPHPGETAAETLVRELEEEVGIVVLPSLLVALGEFSAPAANEHHTTVVADVFTVAGRFEPNPRAEIAELRWLNASDARDLGGRLAPLTAMHFLHLIR